MRLTDGRLARLFERLPRSGLASVYVKLWTTCDQACLFCPIDRRSRFDPDRALASMALVAERGAAPVVSYSGGEPLLYPDMVAVMEGARRLGFTYQDVQTNGGRLAEDLPRLVDAGLSSVTLSVHGHTSRLLRALTGSGNAARLGRTLERLQGTSVHVTTNTVVVRPNLGHLADIIGFVASALPGVKTLVFSAPNIRGRVIPRMGDLVASFREVGPVLREALDLAHACRLDARTLNVPLCVLGPHHDKAQEIRIGWQWLLEADREPELLDRGSRQRDAVYPGPCRGCVLRPLCPGFHPLYRARIGEDAPTVPFELREP